MLADIILKLASDYQALQEGCESFIPANEDLELPHKHISASRTKRERFFDVNLWHDVPLTSIGTPIIYPTNYVPDRVANFMERKNIQEPQNYCLEMFVNDHEFARLWKAFDRMLPELMRFQAIMGIDVSNYRDVPQKISGALDTLGKLLTAKLQRKGMTVIPCVSWRTNQSYEESFEGIPSNSVLAVSNNGILSDELSRYYFVEGVHALKKMRTPTVLIVVGAEMDELKDIVNIRYYQGYSQKYHKGGALWAVEAIICKKVVLQRRITMSLEP